MDEKPPLDMQCKCPIRPVERTKSPSWIGYLQLVFQ